MDRAARPFAIEAAGLTDAGRHRSNNEDQFLIARLETRLRVEASSLPAGVIASSGASSAALLVVSDGMGGHAGGEVASAIAVETVRATVEALLRRRAEDAAAAPDLEDGLRLAFRRAQVAVRARAARERTREHMGATLTVALIEGRRLLIAHAGDSRVCLLRGGDCRQLTSDHTLAEALRSAGAITDTQAIRHHGRHILTNALGTGEDIDVETVWTELEDGDRVLLLSDGCHGLVPAAKIVELAGESGPADVCRVLVDAANAAGGNDNITVVCARARATPTDDDEDEDASDRPVSESDTEPQLQAVRPDEAAAATSPAAAAPASPPAPPPPASKPAPAKAEARGFKAWIPREPEND